MLRIPLCGYTRILSMPGHLAKEIPRGGKYHLRSLCLHSDKPIIVLPPPTWIYRTPLHPNYGLPGFKRDGKYNPHSPKSIIFFLGNHEDRAFNKSYLFAPVLSYSSLWILTSKAIKNCILQQSDWKNTFCNALLPDNEITIVRPPLGDPESSPKNFLLLNKTLNGLQWLTQHWYNLITNIMKYIDITSSKNGPCLLSGIINNITPPTTTRYNIHFGLYVDDFVFL